MLRFIQSKWLWINVITIILLAILLVFGTFQFFKVYTNHGDSITVPDLAGMTIDELDRFIVDYPLRYKVIASSYLKDQPPGVVIEQNPKALSKVKENRRIYLTINTEVAPLTKLPDLTDASLRSATMQLEMRGLEVGELEYIPDIANVVRYAKIDGEVAMAGAEVRKGSKIGLVLGDGLGKTSVQVPHLIGKTYVEALAAIRFASLNIGSVVVNSDVLNKEESFVFQQFPESFKNSGNSVSIGEPVDLYLQLQPIYNSEIDQLIEQVDTTAH